MCGIAGFTRLAGRTQDDPLEVLRGMLAPIRHRGPDGEGVHVGEAAAFGHLRLSIIDLSGGAQPRVDPESGDMLAFNGEIYGFRGLQAELEREGIRLADRSDTEVLFQLLRRDGVERTLERIDGMFAFAWHDGQRRETWLARDRFGEKPLFWSVSGGDLCFASEPAALLRHPRLRDAGVDPRSVAEFMHFEYLPGDRSLRRGIRKLRPGQFLAFTGGEPRLGTYWTPRVEVAASTAAPEAERIARLEELFDRSVRDRLVADVPVGVFLSGGIDSSLVAAFAARHAPGITAFTVRMQDESHDESQAAAQLARALGLRHDIVELDDRALSAAFEGVIARMDEPLADSSLLPTWLVCRAARQSMKVALGGDGADELFAGYVSFKVARAFGAMRMIPASAGRILRRILGLLPPGSGYMAPAFKLDQLSRGFGLEPERQWSAWMSPFAPEELDELGVPPPGLTPFGPVSGVPGLLLAFTATYLPEDILTKVDRASMYNGLEVRAPFLARDFAEYAMSLGVDDKIRGLETKRILRAMARRHIPAAIIDRPKHGFALPLATLLRGPLAGPVEARLLDPASPLRAFCRPAAIERLWREHSDGRRDHRKKIWTLFTLAVAAGPAPGAADAR
jgi:asparagine synthase (glutamine-hydrolysing)